MKKLTIYFIILLTHLNTPCSGMDFFKFVYNDRDAFFSTYSIGTVLISCIVTHRYQKDASTFVFLSSIVAIGCGTWLLLMELFCAKNKIQSQEKTIDYLQKYITLTEIRIEHLKKKNSNYLAQNNILLEQNKSFKTVLDQKIKEELL